MNDSEAAIRNPAVARVTAPSIELPTELSREQEREHGSIDRRRVQQWYYGEPAQIAANILFIKRESRLNIYRDALGDVTEFGNVWRGVTGSLAGHVVSVIATGIGPSQVGDAVYALDRPNSTCIYSGTCGGLNADLRIGDYFLAEDAVCADGSSSNFGQRPFSLVAADSRLVERIAPVCGRSVERLRNGRTFTTSSVVREADADFWRQVSPECKTIEMGAASFYAAARASGKAAAAIFWVSDLPLRGKSFFDRPSREDDAIRQERYDRTAAVDLALLAALVESTAPPPLEPIGDYR